MRISIATTCFTYNRILTIQHEIQGTKLLVVTFLIMQRDSGNNHDVMEWCLMFHFFL
uniref:Uncharacterized protein n=1 Tax=Populus trichocarpa TaxID=3694 RepID=A0A3N7FAG5_POPTR